MSDGAFGATWPGSVIVDLRSQVATLQAERDAARRERDEARVDKVRQIMLVGLRAAERDNFREALERIAKQGCALIGVLGPTVKSCHDVATIRRETLELAADVVEVECSEGCSADHCQSNPVARLRNLAAAPVLTAEYCAERARPPEPTPPGGTWTFDEANRRIDAGGAPPGGLRPARETAHGTLPSCCGDEIDSPHSSTCDHVTAAIERDRPTRRQPTMTRLQAFAASLTREMLEHWHGQQPTEHGVALVAERRIREFCNELTGVTDGVACDWYLDEKAT